MGRYYSGDIKGKFWFGVQSSVAADRFGVQHYEPAYVEYAFYEDDLNGVEEEIKNIEDSLGDKVLIIKELLVSGFTEKTSTEKGITSNDLSEYADLLLGVKISDCLKDNKECHFQAEL